jgi:hypothetical protein
MDTGDPMEPIRFGEVETIEVEKQRMTTVAGSKGLQVGAKVHFRARQGKPYFWVPHDVMEKLRR